MLATGAGLLLAVWASLTAAGCVWLTPFVAAKLKQQPDLCIGFGVIVSGLAGVAFPGVAFTPGKACGRQLRGLVTSFI